MAKDKTDGGASRKARIKIPKQIAGVKIPKALRDSGKAAIRMAQDPGTRAMMSAGLMAAATAVAANARARNAGAANPTPDAAAKTMSDATQAAAETAQQIGAALIGAASEAAQRFFGLNEAKPATSASDAGPSGGSAQSVVEPDVRADASDPDVVETVPSPAAVAALKKAAAKAPAAKPRADDTPQANGVG